MGLAAHAISSVIITLAFLAIALSMVLPELQPQLGQLSAWLSSLRPQDGADPLPPGMARYYELKNASCATLSGDFIISTEDRADGTLHLLAVTLPGERDIAERIADGYDISQTTRTYVHGDWMKKAVVSGGEESTTIWKNGRIYECAGTACSMHVMNESESAAHYDSLHRMRSACMHFGKTGLPGHADAQLLLDITGTGAEELGGNRCEGFLIYANRTYAESLLAGGGLSQDQKALLWALSHLEGPVRECLDESTGIIVYRNLTLDLTGAYLFDYLPGGYMRVSQQTRLEYFSDEVPESFISLPE